MDVPRSLGNGTRSPRRRIESRLLPQLQKAVPTLVQWGHELFARLRAGHRLIIVGSDAAADGVDLLAAEMARRDEGTHATTIRIHARTTSSGPTDADSARAGVDVRPLLRAVRPGDVVMVLSTDARDGALVTAARASRMQGAQVWAVTGATPNPLALACDSAISFRGTQAQVRDAQAVALPMLCHAFDAHAACARPPG